MPDDIRYAGPGPLSSIEDKAVAREIRNLWSVVSARSGQVGGEGQKWVTVDDLNAAKREVLGKMPDTLQKAGSQKGGGSIVTGNSSESNDILGLDNTWTGTNTWDRDEQLRTNNWRFRALTSGPISSFTAQPTILWEQQDYQAAVDIQKSSDSSLFQGLPGGNAALYVQHRGGGSTVGAVGVYGMRAQAESICITPGPTANNAVAAGMFRTHNATTNGVGWGVKVDILHKATAGANGALSIGVEANLYRYFLDGQVIGFHARVMSAPPYAADVNYGFLAGPNFPGAATRMRTAFAAGSSVNGSLNCDVGLDLAYASSDLAAIRIAPRKKLTFNGEANNVGICFDPAGKLQFFSDIGNTASIGNDGSVRVKANTPIQLNDGGVDVLMRFVPSGAISFEVGGTPVFQLGTGGQLIVNNPTTVGGAGSLVGYWQVNLGGFLRYIPFYR